MLEKWVFLCVCVCVCVCVYVYIYIIHMILHFFNIWFWFFWAFFPRQIDIFSTFPSTFAGNPVDIWHRHLHTSESTSVYTLSAAVAILPCADLYKKFWAQLFGDCRYHRVYLGRKSWPTPTLQLAKECSRLFLCAHGSCFNLDHSQKSSKVLRTTTWPCTALLLAAAVCTYLEWAPGMLWAWLAKFLWRTCIVCVQWQTVLKKIIHTTNYVNRSSLFSKFKTTIHKWATLLNLWWFTVSAISPIHSIIHALLWM